MDKCVCRSFGILRRVAIREYLEIKLGVNKKVSKHLFINRGSEEEATLSAVDVVELARVYQPKTGGLSYYFKYYLKIWKGW